MWRRTFTVPAGTWNFKVALDDAFDENYGLPGSGAPNVVFTQASSGPVPVRFYFDPVSHYVTNNLERVIAVAPGSFQSELGCPSDWAPDCLRSLLEDPDRDGIYAFTTTTIPAGSYATKVALNESWDVNYGAGGEQSGADIAFTVAKDGDQVRFRYNASTHAMTVQTGPDPTATPEPTVTPKPGSPTPSPTAGPAPTPTPAPTVSAAPAPTIVPVPTLGPIATVKPKQVDAALSGVRVTVSGAPQGSTITVKVFRGKVRIGKRSRPGGAATTSIRVPIDAAARRALRHAKSVTLNVRTTVTGAGVNTTLNAPVTLRRQR